MTIDIYLDESGNFNSQYFIIGGFILQNDLNNLSLNKMKRNFKSVFKKMKMKLNLDKDQELKTRSIEKSKDKQEVIYNLKNYGQILFSFAVNLNTFKKKSVNKKINVIFNYLIGVFLERLCKKYIKIDIQEDIQFNLNIDNRSIGVGSLKSLEEYLYITSYFAQKNNVFFKVKYLESKHFWSIQYADFIANTLYLYKNEIMGNQKIEYSIKKHYLQIKNKFTLIDENFNFYI